MKPEIMLVGYLLNDIEKWYVCGKCEFFTTNS
jgi:hypothetical protein